MKYEFDLFMPSKRILEAICWEEPACSRYYQTFPPMPPEKDGGVDEVLFASVLGLPELLSWFYLATNGEQCGKNLHKVAMLAMEQLKNSREHGSKKGLPFTYGLFAGKAGVCHGFLDGDREYFARQDIKDVWENKRPLPEFDKEGGAARIGVEAIIYPCSDIIEVDTEAGVLYLAQLLENLPDKVK